MCAAFCHNISLLVIGSFLTLRGRVTHTSNKSVEVQVVVDGESPFLADGRRYRAVEAYFVFVSLDSNRNVQAVPPLRVI